MDLQFNVNKNDINNMMDDIGKMVTYVMVVHVLSYIVDNEGELFSMKILKKILWVTVSMFIYNLFVRKLLIK